MSWLRTEYRYKGGIMYDIIEVHRCGYCKGSGQVGGLFDGDEYIPIEDCAGCNGSGEQDWELGKGRVK